MFILLFLYNFISSHFGNGKLYSIEWPTEQSIIHRVKLDNQKEFLWLIKVDNKHVH